MSELRVSGEELRQRVDRSLRVAMADPRERTTIQELQQMTRLQILPVLAPATGIRRAHLLYKREVREMLDRTLVEATTEVERPGKGAAGARRIPGAPEPLRSPWGAGTRRGRRRRRHEDDVPGRPRQGSPRRDHARRGLPRRRLTR